MTIVGSCPKCGAPIYAPTFYHSIMPPPPQYTCDCTAHLRGGTTTTSTFVWPSSTGTVILRDDDPRITKTLA